MSQTETSQPSTRIEGLGGSFSRNVKIGNDGLGMLYDKPGDIFHLRAVWEDSQGAGTSIAPGTFEFIYFREEFDGNTYINRISSSGVWVRAVLDKEGTSRVEFERLQDILEDETPHDLIIEKSNSERPVVTEVVLKKWGHFTDQDKRYSAKMKLLFGRDMTIPTTSIDIEFNKVAFPHK